MIEYTPDEFPEITVLFDYQPEEPQAWDHPGCPEDVEITGIEINGAKVGPDLEDDLIGRHGDKWEEEILEMRLRV